MKNYIITYLENSFEELSPIDFYREIFPIGELQQKGVVNDGKYSAIAVELLPRADKYSNQAKKFLVFDDLEGINDLLQSNNFIIMAPISYVGISRHSSNARYIYAMAIDFDGITEENHLIDLFHQIEIEYLPKPTSIVFSGNGLHLYYVFETPVPCYPSITKPLGVLKKALTKKIWNGFTTSLAEKPQIESLFQGFRLVGGVTKDGKRTRAFSMGDKVTIDYLNGFVSEEFRVKQYKAKSKISLEEAQKRYPEWYQSRVVEHQPKGTWVCKRDLYDWWLRRLKSEAIEGHRYYAVMVLAVMAKKCAIPFNELEKDAFSLVEHLDILTTRENNHFTRADVLSALEMYNENYIRFPIDSIVSLTHIPIKKNKRNGRTREVHLKIARANRMILKEAGLISSIGRPTKEAEFKKWRENNPNGTKAQCERDTGMSYKTINKYWD